MSKSSVFIVEPDGYYRSFIRINLEAAGFRIAGEAASAREALHALFSTEAVPSLILVEVAMKYMTGYDTARAIRHLRPESSIVFMSASDLDEARGRAFGARGMVWKNPTAVDFASELVRICTLIAAQTAAASGLQPGAERQLV